MEKLLNSKGNNQESEKNNIQNGNLIYRMHKAPKKSAPKEQVITINKQANGLNRHFSKEKI
jgi:hypothetical protein